MTPIICRKKSNLCCLWPHEWLYGDIQTLQDHLPPRGVFSHQAVVDLHDLFPLLVRQTSLQQGLTYNTWVLTHEFIYLHQIILKIYQNVPYINTPFILFLNNLFIKQSLCQYICKTIYNPFYLFFYLCFYSTEELEGIYVCRWFWKSKSYEHNLQMFCNVWLILQNKQEKDVIDILASKKKHPKLKTQIFGTHSHYSLRPLIMIQTYKETICISTITEFYHKCSRDLESVLLLTHRNRLVVWWGSGP